MDHPDTLRHIIGYCDPDAVVAIYQTSWFHNLIVATVVGNHPHMLPKTFWFGLFALRLKSSYSSHYRSDYGTRILATDRNDFEYLSKLKGRDLTDAISDAAMKGKRELAEGLTRSKKELKNARFILALANCDLEDIELTKVPRSVLPHCKSLKLALSLYNKTEFDSTEVTLDAVKALLRASSVIFRGIQHNMSKYGGSIEDMKIMVQMKKYNVLCTLPLDVILEVIDGIEIPRNVWNNIAHNTPNLDVLQYVFLKTRVMRIQTEGDDITDNVLLIGADTNNGQPSTTSNYLNSLWVNNISRCNLAILDWLKAIGGKIDEIYIIKRVLHEQSTLASIHLAVHYLDIPMTRRTQNRVKKSSRNTSGSDDDIPNNTGNVGDICDVVTYHNVHDTNNSVLPDDTYTDDVHISDDTNRLDDSDFDNVTPANVSNYKDDSSSSGSTIDTDPDYSVNSNEGYNTFDSSFSEESYSEVEDNEQTICRELLSSIHNASVMEYMIRYFHRRGDLTWDFFTRPTYSISTYNVIRRLYIEYTGDTSIWETYPLLDSQ